MKSLSVYEVSAIMTLATGIAYTPQVVMQRTEHYGISFYSDWTIEETLAQVLIVLLLQEELDVE